MSKKVLIANRGEIALRIQRACRTLGLKTVAVYSAADRDARHVALADDAVCIGPAAPRDSYLSVREIILAAELTGADLVHPGYGFLSENAEFAECVASAGLVLVGPPPSVIRLMGNKISAKRAMLDAGVPCVPGSQCVSATDLAAARQAALGIGWPLIVKAAGGGGGRGMRIVRSQTDLADALIATGEEADRAFGDPSLYLERYLARPRHIEIQVLVDNDGSGVFLGERDCSMQRRHQKILEEAPAPHIPPRQIEDIGMRCAAAAAGLGYRGAGTFEFLYENEEFHFIEMNTRLQVEHPVTEMVTGIDVVEQQLRIALGEPLAFCQSDITVSGHAIECRINAEDPRTFVPSPGRITVWEPPGGPGIRVDSHAFAGCAVPPQYDSLVAKIISHAPTRGGAIARMSIALSELRVAGIQTNVPLHCALMDDPAFIAGGTDVGYLERHPGMKSGRTPTRPPSVAMSTSLEAAQ